MHQCPFREHMTNHYFRHHFQINVLAKTLSFHQVLRRMVIRYSCTPNNRTKRQYARIFLWLWLTSLLLLTSHPLLSLLTSTCAVYTMHGGTWFSHKNFKWMSALIISFCISLYSLTLSAESDFVDEERAYELKAVLVLEMKHRAAEMIWGGILLLCLGLTVKERIDGVTKGIVEKKNKKQT